MSMVWKRGVDFEFGLSFDYALAAGLDRSGIND